MWKYFAVACICLFVQSSWANQWESRIVGGETDVIARAPYMVSIRYKKNNSTPFEHRCSGTIYSSDIILTTATCVIGLDVNRIHVKVGSSHRNQLDGSLYLVEKYLVHPDYNIWFTDNDLAIVKLAFSLYPYPTKEIAAITVADQLPAAQRQATVSGWGTTNPNANTEFADQLRVAQVTVIEDSQCRAAYGGNHISEAMFCAGSNGVDACHGDAGGALVYQNKAAGLVSWGHGCGNIEYPGVYTNLVLFKSWIESEVGKL